MGGVGPGAGAGPIDAQAMANDALQPLFAPQLIEAVQRGISVQELADMFQVPENQAAELMQVVREGVLMFALVQHLLQVRKPLKLDAASILYRSGMLCCRVKLAQAKHSPHFL